MLEKDVRDFFFKTKESYNIVFGQRELGIEGLRIDLFAIDKDGNPFVIEFKKDKNRHIVGQAAQYLALFPSKQETISKKFKLFNVKWDNLKVLCIAKGFNKRDYEALNFEPIKGKVFLYEYEIIKDYREESIFGLNIHFNKAQGESPLFLPPVPEHALDFGKHFSTLAKIEGKENKRQFYTATILPLLKEVAEELRIIYSDQKLYPHISYFQSGPHVLFRLGPDPKKPHHAALFVSFFEDTISYGFDLTHNVADAQKLKQAFGTKTELLTAKILSAKDCVIYMPNSGIDDFLPLEFVNAKGLKMLFDHYTPITNRDCYFRISDSVERTVLTGKEILQLFDRAYKKFGFLMQEIRVAEISR